MLERPEVRTAWRLGVCGSCRAWTECGRYVELVRFGRGQGRPRGRIARGSFGSKGKVSEWRNFGVEQLLGAVNGEEP